MCLRKTRIFRKTRESVTPLKYTCLSPVLTGGPWDQVASQELFKAWDRSSLWASFPDGSPEPASEAWSQEDH